MSAMDQLVTELFKLSDDAYLRRDGSLGETMPWAAMQYDFKGLALGAPREVTLATHDLLPALLVTGESAARSAQIPLLRNAIAVAVDLDRGTVLYGEAFLPDPSKSPMPEREFSLQTPAQVAEETTEDDSGDGDSAGAVWLDFRELLRVPWEESRLALRVIAYDEASNAAIVHLSGLIAPEAGFSRAKAFDILRRSRAGFEIDSKLPRFVASEKTPQLTENGVALALGVSEAPAGTDSFPVHGALRLEVSAQSIVAASERLRLPAAVIEATILITAKNVNRPIQIGVNVPVWSDLELKTGDPVDAAFSIDLAKVLPVQLAAGAYCVYLIAGPYISGPHRLVLKPSGL